MPTDPIQSPDATHNKDLTLMLEQWRGGCEASGEIVINVVYDELRRLAERYIVRESPGHTLQATALVHEAYLRLVGEQDPGLENRAHLVGISSRLMRQVLVNHAKSRNAVKRGGTTQKISLEGTAALFESKCVDLVELDDALQRLGEQDEQMCYIVEMKFFGGMTMNEIAEHLDIPLRSVERDWSLARAWLHRELANT